MTFAKAFKLSSYLLLLSGFVSLFASEAIGPLLSLLYLLVMMLSWRIRIFYHGWMQVVVFFALVVFFLVDALTFSDFVSATVHLLIIVSLIKLFSATTDRDYWVLYLISFGFLLFASAYTISIAFLVSLVLYIFSAILTFILFESKKAYEENLTSPFSLLSYVNVALVITGLIILISIPIFLVIPRTAFGLFRVDRHLDLNMSGFSDQVRLGDMGEIIMSSNVLMRVKIDTPLENVPVDLKWRGIGLNRYDGKKWSNTREGFRRIHHDHNYGGLLISENRRHNEFLIQQTIFLEPFSNMIFGAPEIVLIAGEGLRRSFVFEDGNGSLGVYRRGRGPIKYVAYSDFIRRHEKLSRPVEGAVSELIQRRYLQLPEINPEIHRLALEVTREQEDSVDKALALEQFLKQTYGYSLANESAKAEDPLSDFLFVTKAGHCEFFATAQAVMMRTLGIPTRLVNGFRRGEFNDFSGYLVVRQSDAHSWVEGYFPGPGWVEFDPTPSVAPLRPLFSVTRTFSQLLDAIDILWTELVTFDRIKQIGFFQSLGDSFRDTWRNVSRSSRRLSHFASLGWLEDLKHWNLFRLVYLLSGGLLGLAFWLLYRYRRYFRAFWKQRVLKRKSSEIAPEYYLEMLDLLDRRGLVKKPAETPAEFVDRIQPDFTSPIPGLITRFYYGNRFGHLPLRERDLSEIYQWLWQLR
jgi:protein-glutamine gamma-glutamyltransferase